MELGERQVQTSLDATRQQSGQASGGPASVEDPSFSFESDALGPSICSSSALLLCAAAALLRPVRAYHLIGVSISLFSSISPPCDKNEPRRTASS